MSSVITTIRIEPGFSAQELQVDFDRAKMEQIQAPVKAVEVDEDAKPLRYKLAESLLTEIQHYKAIQEFKDRLTPKFIAVFNQAEQNFLRQFIAVLEEYLQQQQRYVNELLALAGYADLDAFAAELAAIPEVAAVISPEAGSDLFSKLIPVMGIKRSDMVSFLARKLHNKNEAQLNIAIDDKVARFLPIARRHMTNHVNLPARLFAYARVFDNVQAYYSASTLEQDAAKHAIFQTKFASKKTATQVGSHTLSSLITKMITNERELMFNDMAKAPDAQGLLPTGEKIVECIQTIREAVKKSALQIYEAMGDISQVSTGVRAPRNVQKPEGIKPTAAADMDNLADDEPADLQAELPFSDFARFVSAKVKAFQDIAQTKIASAIEDARVSGWKFVYERKADRTIAEEVPHDFKRGDNVKVYHHEHHVFTVKPEKVRTDVAGNVVSEGVGVFVHRHTDQDIHLAVQVMVEAMAKAGEKEIAIAIDAKPGNVKAERLILNYARVILSQSAIPILMDGKRALSRKESKEKLRQIAQRLGDQEALKNVVARYSAEVARIESAQQRDKNFLEALKVFLPHARTLYTMRDPNDTRKQMNLADIAIYVTAIALVHKNLTEDALIDYIVSCAKAALPQEEEMSAAKISEVTKQLRSDLSRYLVQSPNISPQELGPRLFGRALTALTPHHLSRESAPQALFHRRSTYSLDMTSTPANKPQFARLGIFGNPCPNVTNVKDKTVSPPISKPVEAKQHTFLPRMGFLGNSCCATAVKKAKAVVVSTISPEPTRGLVK